MSKKKRMGLVVGSGGAFTYNDKKVPAARCLLPGSGDDWTRCFQVGHTKFFVNTRADAAAFASFLQDYAQALMKLSSIGAGDSKESDDAENGGIFLLNVIGDDSNGSGGTHYTAVVRAKDKPSKEDVVDWLEEEDQEQEDHEWHNMVDISCDAVIVTTPDVIDMREEG